MSSGPGDGSPPRSGWPGCVPSLRGDSGRERSRSAGRRHGRGTGRSRGRASPAGAAPRTAVLAGGSRGVGRSAPGPGLRLALGIGEAPVGLQHTFSVWSSSAALNAFAYTRAAHASVVERTEGKGRYAEELLARFGVLSTKGTLNGVDPLAR
ncbi:MAG: hypothetical protein ACLGI3_00210 [Actinomycetes bacterium]